METNWENVGQFFKKAEFPSTVDKRLIRWQEKGDEYFNNLSISSSVAGVLIVGASNLINCAEMFAEYRKILDEAFCHHCVVTGKTMLMEVKT